MAQTNPTDYTYVASGSPDFLVPFPYLSTSEVEVTVDGASTGVIWTALNSVQLTPTPAVGAAVRIRRNTDARAVRNDFSAGAPFSPRNINENNEQLLYAVEEAVHVAASAEDFADSVLGVADSALTVANAAAATANAASAVANAIAGTADSAFAAAAAASAAANAAVATADGIAATANTALSNSVTAVNTANATAGDSATALAQITVLAGNLASVQDRVGGFVHASEFDLLGNGSDETIKIQAAVSAAFSSGAPLYWPPGEYVLSGPIPNFYSVKHIGPGIVKDGGTLPITTSPTTSVTLNVAPSGSNDNLGLSPSRPLATIGAAIDAIPPFASGTWVINIAAGTYTEGVNVRKATNPNLNIILQGPTVAFGAQTVILEGAAQSPSVPGVYVEDLAKVSIKHIKVRNFVHSGVYFLGCGTALLDNVSVFNCGTPGRELVRNSHGVLVVSGCQLDGNNNSLNGFVCYHGFMSVIGESTVTKCTGAAALYANASGGHFDTNLVSNCSRGLYALQGGFPTISGGSISNCTTSAIESDQGSYIVIASNPIFSGNGVNVRQIVNTGINGKVRDDTTRTALFANNDTFDVITQSGGAFMMQLGNNGLTIPGGAWNSRRLVLGSYHLWVDGSGRLRIKNGAPASDADGAVVGTQV